MWYVAHVIMYFELVSKRARPKDIAVYENMFLIKSKDEDSAFRIAEAIGKGQEGDRNGSLKTGGRKAVMRFGGVRKLIRCAGVGKPGSRTELTYSRLRMNSTEDLKKLGRGDSVQVVYEE